MTQSVLWAPWRIDYILGSKEKKGTPENPGSCPFCHLPHEQQNRDNLILKRTRYSFVMLNRYPYSSGHLLVLPLAHCADLKELEREPYLDLMLLLKESIQKLQLAMQPAGINAGLNLGKAAGAGIADHLHFHIVPRWPGDHNFMPVIADTMVLPQHLDAAYDMLKPYFDRSL